MLPLRWLRDVFLRRPFRVRRHPPTVRAETQFAPRQCWLKLTLITHGAARLFIVTHDYAAAVRAPPKPAVATLRCGHSGAPRRPPPRRGRRRLALGICTGWSRVALSFLNNCFRRRLPGHCRPCRRHAAPRHEFSWGARGILSIFLENIYAARTFPVHPGGKKSPRCRIVRSPG